MKKMIQTDKPVSDNAPPDKASLNWLEFPWSVGGYNRAQYDSSGGYTNVTYRTYTATTTGSNSTW